MLVIFNSCLAQTSGTCAVEVMPVSVIAQVTEFHTQLSEKFDSFQIIYVEYGSFRWSDQL